MKSLLFMAFVALPLNTITGVIADVEDFVNIAYRLLNFLIGVAAIALSWLGRSVLGSLLSRVDGVVAS